MKVRLVMVILVLVVMNLFTFNPPALCAQEKGPIKIGYIIPVTGAFAEVGRDMTNGTAMLLEEIGYRAGGRKIGAHHRR